MLASESLLSLASVQPIHTSAQLLSLTRCRLVGTVGGNVSLLGGVTTLTTLLALALPPEKSEAVTLNEYPVPGCRWRMTADVCDSQLMFCVIRAPFRLMP